MKSDRSYVSASELAIENCSIICVLEVVTLNGKIKIQWEVATMTLNHNLNHTWLMRSLNWCTCENCLRKSLRLPFAMTIFSIFSNNFFRPNIVGTTPKYFCHPSTSNVRKKI